MTILVISHVGMGGAYRVARYYSEILSARLVVRPSILQIVKLALDKPKTIIFHAPHQCAKYTWIVKIISVHTKIWCVEHFILPQIVRSEMSTRFERFCWFGVLRWNSLLGVKVVCIDKISEIARRRLIGVSSDMIVGNLIVQKKKYELTKPYDWVWSAGMNDQKRWCESRDVLVTLKKQRPDLKILVCSYSEPIPSDMSILAENGIDFRLNETEWHTMAEKFFFTSSYEGFPLALAEAMVEGMGILAWCRRSCYSQLLKHYKGARWLSHNFTPSVQDFELTPKTGTLDPSCLQEHRKEKVDAAIAGLVIND